MIISVQSFVCLAAGAVMLACSFPDDGLGERVVRGLDAGEPGRQDAQMNAKPTLFDASTVDVTPFSEAEIQRLFERMCFACHIEDDREDLRLNDPFTRSTVGVDSRQRPGWTLIQRGDHTRSYLFRKVEGSHLESGGEGARMPEDGPPYLTKTELDRFAAWIDAL